jgi:translation initiation factor IF-1
MPKDDHVSFSGVVTSVYAGGMFEVVLDNEAKTSIKARLSGKLRKNRIRVILGDRIEVSMSPYDLTHGMITYRNNK